MTKTWIAALALGLGIAVGWTAATMLEAQPTGIKRTLLMKTELTGIDGREVYLGTAEIAPGAIAGRHYARRSRDRLRAGGHCPLRGRGPGARRRSSPATTTTSSAGKRHDVRNSGAGPAKVLAIYLIEKGKPLAVPAP